MIRNSDEKNESDADTDYNCSDSSSESPGLCLQYQEKWYFAKEKGPCPANMILISKKRNSSEGICVCNCDLYQNSSTPYQKDPPPAFCKGQTETGQIRTLAYYKKYEDFVCQPIFEKGMCRRKQWLIFDETGEEDSSGENPVPKCKRRHANCTASSSPEDELRFFDSQTNRCQRIRGKCQPSPEDQDETSGSDTGVSRSVYRYEITDDDWRPRCILQKDEREDSSVNFEDDERDVTININPNACPKSGEKRSSKTGKCATTTGGRDFG